MKTLSIALLSSSLVLFATTATAKLHQTSELDQRICSSIKDDNKTSLRGKLKTNRLSMNTIYATTTCDNQNVLDFAINQNATETAKYILSKTSSSYLEADKEVYLAAIEKRQQKSVAETSQNKVAP